MTIAAPSDGIVQPSKQQATVINPQEAVAEGGSRLKRIALNCYTVY